MASILEEYSSGRAASGIPFHGVVVIEVHAAVWSFSAFCLHFSHPLLVTAQVQGNSIHIGQIREPPWLRSLMHHKCQYLL